MSIDETFLHVSMMADRDVLLGPVTDVLRIANCSGFYGDRLSAAREMVEDGPIDVLTGDYLAELTMALLWRQQAKRAESGYATTFLLQVEEILATCLERGIKIVSNAGGLNPKGLAARVDQIAAAQGLAVQVATVTGDDLMHRIGELGDFPHADTGEPRPDMTPVTANAYLGGWGIAEALAEGADVVVTGRVTDAALVIGPSAWKFGWAREDWDRLAGALVAGHIIECGAQCTGGNYAFFEEVSGLEHVGFPIAEMRSDGSSAITKHPGTGGLVSVGTVTAQLLYEIGGPIYLNPDVCALFDTIRLSQDGADRVLVSGVEGTPPPSTAKVALNYLGGYRNSVTFVIPGLNGEEKVRAALSALWTAVGTGFEEVDVSFRPARLSDPVDNEAAMGELKVTVKDSDPTKVGRSFSGGAVELALASYPGFMLTSPPADASPYAVYWPTVMPASSITQIVELEGVRKEVPSTAGDGPGERSQTPTPEAKFEGSTRRVPLGDVFGARSGDKGGNANVGVWAPDEASFAWLNSWLDVDRFRELIPEARTLEVERHVLANLLALNFVVFGLLGEGVASSTRADPQAKTLGEYLRARLAPIPEELMG